MTLQFSNASSGSVLVSLWLRTAIVFSCGDSGLLCDAADSLLLLCRLLLLLGAAVEEWRRVIGCGGGMGRLLYVGSLVGDFTSNTELSESMSDSILVEKKLSCDFFCVYKVLCSFVRLLRVGLKKYIPVCCQSRAISARLCLNRNSNFRINLLWIFYRLSDWAAAVAYKLGFECVHKLF